MNLEPKLSAAKGGAFLRILLVVLAGAGMFFLSADGPVSGKFWTAWYPLMIPGDRISDPLEDRLNGLAGGELLGEHSASLIYNGFGSWNSVTSRELSRGEGLLDADPRLDPFMIRTGLYFNQDIYKIYYLPADRSPLQYRRQLQSLPGMEDSGWIFPDGRVNLPLLVLFLAASCVLMFRGRGFLLPGLMLTLYLMRGVWTGHEVLLLPGLAGGLALKQLAAAKKIRPVPAGCLVLIIGAGLWSGSLSAADAAALLLTGAAALLLPEPAERGERKRGERKRGGRKRRDHDLFQPVLLSAPRQEVPVSLNGERNRGLIGSAAALVPVVLFLMMSRPAAVPLPAGLPRGDVEEGSRWTWENVVSAGGAELPGPGEYLMHRAYQESYPYGGTWGMPVPGEVVRIPDYDLEEGRIRSRWTTVLEYDQPWLDSTLSLMDREGPGILFQGEPGPPVVSLSRQIPASVEWSVYAVYVTAVFVILLLGLLEASGNSRNRRIDYRMRNYFMILRRKQQAA